MSLFSWNRSRKSKSWSAPRGRRGRNAVKPRIEGLEERLALSVSTQVVNHTLLVTNNGTDNITLDHSNGTTFVEAQSFGQSFADGSIYNGISLNIGGKSTLNIKANALPIAVEGNNAVATVNLGNSLHGVQDIKAHVDLHHLALSVNPPFGVVVPQLVFELNVDDSADQNGRNVTLNAANKVGTITGLAPATITYDYEIQGAGTVDIRAGRGGDFFDVVNTFDALEPDPAILGIFPGLNESGIGPNLTIHGNNLGGGLTVDVQGTADSGAIMAIDAPGSSNAYVNVSNNGTLNGIHGEIHLTGHTYATVNDVADTTPRDFQLGSNGISLVASPSHPASNPPSIFYDNNAYAGIWGGQGYDTTFEVLGTPSGGAGVYPGSSFSAVDVTQTTGPLEIGSNGGQNYIYLGKTNSVQGLNGPVLVDNWGGGLNSLFVYDTADPNGHTVSLDSANGWGTIKGLAPATITYDNRITNYLSIFTGGGTNAVNVNSINVHTDLYGGSGNLYVYVGAATGTLDGIQAELDLTGGSGNNYLGIYDYNSFVAHHYYYTNDPAGSTGHFQRSGGSTPTVNIYYTNFMGGGYPYVSKGYAV
jgi:hypothetical protein